MNRRAVWAIAKKDMRGIGANLQVWLPMLILPVILGILIPGGMMWALHVFGLDAAGDLQDLVQVLDRMPDSSVKESIHALPTLEQQIAYFVMNYLMAPLFLLIPLMASSVVSADSFAGEKERGTLESLLFTPVKVLDLFAGKVLAALLPGVGLSLITFLCTAIVVNGVGWPLFGHVFFPNVNWLPLMLLVIPMLSLAAILVNVFVSARVATFQAAYQLGGLVILPVLAVLFGQISGLLFLDAPVVTFIGLVLAVIDLLLLIPVRNYLDRSRLFESQVD